MYPDGRVAVPACQAILDFHRIVVKGSFRRYNRAPTLFILTIVVSIIDAQATHA